MHLFSHLCVDIIHICRFDNWLRFLTLFKYRDFARPLVSNSCKDLPITWVITQRVDPSSTPDPADSFAIPLIVQYPLTQLLAGCMA